VYSGLYGISTLLALGFSSYATINTLELWEAKVNLLRLGLVYAVLVLPFFFGGLVVGLAITRFVDRLNRLYFFDLLLAGQENAIEQRIFSSTAEVEVTRSTGLPPIAGGDFGLLDASWIMGRFVGQDGTAPTALYHDAGHLEKYPFLDDSQTAAAYLALQARHGAPLEI